MFNFEYNKTKDGWELKRDRPIMNDDILSYGAFDIKHIRNYGIKSWIQKNNCHAGQFHAEKIMHQTEYIKKIIEEKITSRTIYFSVQYGKKI